MRILTLDLATKTGYAYWDGTRLVQSGTKEFVRERGESPGMRFLRFRAWLKEMEAVCPHLDLVVYEQAHHRGGAATEIGVGLVTHLQAWCAEHGIEHTKVHSATLKKSATGSGRASKADVIQAMQARWGVVVSDDNEADALALLDWALKHYDVQVSHTGGGA